MKFRLLLTCKTLPLLSRQFKNKVSERLEQAEWIKRGGPVERGQVAEFSEDDFRGVPFDSALVDHYFHRPGK